MSEETVNPPAKRRRGRPPKKKEANPVGRPKGEAGIMKEYKERMLNSPKSRKVLDKMFEIAFDDEHRHQAAVLKMIADRIIPVEMFTQEISKGNSKPTINISISGIGGDVSIGESSEDIEDGEILEGDYDEYIPENDN